MSTLTAVCIVPLLQNSALCLCILLSVYITQPGATRAGAGYGDTVRAGPWSSENVLGRTKLCPRGFGWQSSRLVTIILLSGLLHFWVNSLRQNHAIFQHFPVKLLCQEICKSDSREVEDDDSSLKCRKSRKMPKLLVWLCEAPKPRDFCEWLITIVYSNFQKPVRQKMRCEGRGRRGNRFPRETSYQIWMILQCVSVTRSSS